MTPEENFENRPRYAEKEARMALEHRAGSMVMHLLDNQDGTFSIMEHIVCEHCDYCTEQGDARLQRDIKAVVAKADPYENQNG